MRRTRRPHLPIVLIGLATAAGVHATTVTIAANPLTVSLSYTKGGNLPTARVTIVPTGTTSSVYFTVNPISLPPWLQVDRTNGTSTTAAPGALVFSPSLVAANSPAGMYSAPIEIDSLGLANATVTVNMTVANAAPTVTASLALSTSSWMVGTAPPTGILTVRSSGDPVLFTVSAPPIPAGTPTWILLSAPSAVAYSWGTLINVTFAPSVFDNPNVGATLTGQIVVRGGSTTVPNIPVAITIGAPAATILSISPKQLPQVITPASAVRTIAVQGASFANGMTVKLGGASGNVVASNCATFASGSGDAWCLQSSEQFFLRLSSGTLAGAGATGNQLVLYLSAGANGLPGQINIPVVTAPIVYAVTDAASFAQPLANQFLSVAPYEMLSIFGDNFGSFGALPGAAIGFTNLRLPNVSADSTGAQLKVHFSDASGNALVADSDGYLLLWTSNQINVLVPSTLPFSTGGQELQATVVVGNLSSPPGNATTFNVVLSSSAMLTFGGGQGVVVNGSDNSINASANPARFGSTIVLYLSGMGAPMDGSAFAGNPGPALSGFAECATPASFLAAATTALHPTWLTFDGAVIDRSILGLFALAPCFDPSTVSVKIGGVTLTGAVTSAGFTADSIAGLYQVNVAVPLSTAASLASIAPPATTTATAYPIQVSINSASSQPGVNVYLAK